MGMMDLATSYGVSVARLGLGLSAVPPAKYPKKKIEIYEFEACPYCRKVREALTDLDLQVLIYPCPKGGKLYRPAVQERGGRASFPFLVDPNSNIEMYESDDIIDYLYKTYGGRSPSILLRLGPITLLNSQVASMFRPTRGSRARPSRRPEKALELYSFEASPYCRIVREVLCELELPYLLHNVGKGSPSREAFVKRSGKMMVPYLVDPNTGKEMFESDDIRDYLLTTYADS